MADPAQKDPAVPEEETLLARESLPEAMPGLPDFPADPFGDYAPPIPPDNEFGDGVREPIDYKKVPGIKGFGGWTKSHSHSVYAEMAGDVGEIWPGASVVVKS